MIHVVESWEHGAYQKLLQCPFPHGKRRVTHWGGSGHVSRTTCYDLARLFCGQRPPTREDVTIDAKESKFWRAVRVRPSPFFALKSFHGQTVSGQFSVSSADIISAGTR